MTTVETIDPATLPGAARVALYGLMFAMAAADGAVADDEIDLIYRSLDLSTLSEQGRRRVHGYLLAPGAIGELLAPLRTAADAVRFGVMVEIVEIALADDRITDAERALLGVARTALGVRDDQLRAIESWVTAARATRHLDAGDPTAIAAMERVTEVLESTGVPRSATTLADVTPRPIEGDDEPGDNVALRLGAAVYFAAARLFDEEGRRRQRAFEESQRQQLVIANLRASIDIVRARMGMLAKRPGGARPGEAEALAARLAALEALLARHRGGAERAPDPARAQDAPAGPRLEYSDVRDDIQDADVMMFRGEELVSRVIKAGAHSAYSHAGLVVWWHRRAMLLDARRAGVGATPLSVGIHGYRGVVDWYRIRPEHRARADVMKIIEEAQRNLGLPYAGDDLVRAALNEVAGLDLPPDCERPEALFCSQYVARCFRVGGLPLHPQRDIATVPSEVALSPVLEFVGTIVPDLDAHAARESVDKA